MGRSLEPEGVTCLQLLANGRRNRGEVKTGERRGGGEEGCTSWAHEERRWVVERVVETRRGRGWRWSMYLPSFLRTPCLRVSFSQCRKPTYRPPLPLPSSSSFCHFRLSPAPSLHSPVSTTFTAPPLWSVKLFGRDRRLVISWPRLSSSGLVLTRRHSTRRIHWIRIVVEMLQILGSNLCDGLVRGATHGGGGGRGERSTALYIN